MTEVVEPKPAAQETPREEPGKVLVRAPLRGEITRRSLFSVLSLSWVTFAAASAAFTGALTRFMFPNVLYEPPMEFKVGYPPDFSVDAVDERFKATRGIWIVREAAGFYCLSTTCTHLGCTPNWLSAEEKFKCPCHGSGFQKTGINFEGPAPRPLERYKITLAEDGQILIDKNTKFQEEKGQWTLEGAYLSYVG
ncbi:MAG TPA: ubiquinol-cytochrome c reductase iron-sulfur subunit [Planctomycetota bacterium]|nr:ubiquinol-cytochrome c reductase iron-sulfur subunit [Planctomycetota bacterium]